MRALRAGDHPGADSAMTAEEQRGLRLFITPSRTACLNCHNGPLLSNGGFHDIGTNIGADSTGELGRMLGAQLLERSGFRCDGLFSDALPAECTATRFAKTETGEGRGAFKVPTLRNLSRTAPFMHDGRYATLRAVLEHYRHPPLPDSPGAHELKAIDLSDAEVDALARFLGTLDDPLPAAPARTIRLLKSP